MAHSYKKATKKAILQKVNRKRNPVTSLVALAQEFGINTKYYRWQGGTGNAAPRSFRQHVRNTVGTKVYNEIRDSSKVTSHSYGGAYARSINY